AHADRLVQLRADGKTYALLGEVLAARGESEAAKTAFESAIEKKAPQLYRVHASLARLALARGDDASAAEHFNTALQMRPRSAAIANDLARLLATSADPSVRNAEVAIAAAEQLAKVEENPEHLDTLAAAYAAGGRFEDAVRTGSRAAELAEQRRDS